MIRLGNITYRLAAIAVAVGLAAVGLSGNPLQDGGPNKDFKFVENVGQWDMRAQYHANVGGLDMWMLSNGIIYDFYKYRPQTLNTDPTNQVARYEDAMRDRIRDGQVIGLEFVGSSTYARAEGAGQKPGVFNYITGDGNYSGARLFEETLVKNLYDGVDLRSYFDNGKPRFDLIVAPGADPNVIQAHYIGADSVRVINDREVGIMTRFGEINLGGLFAYQMKGGVKVPIPVKFKIEKGIVGYILGNYDRSKELVIDPVIWSTLLGAAGTVDLCNDVVADSQGNNYVVGTTDGGAFPTVFGSYDEFAAGIDAFITKLSPEASDLVYSTFVGGTRTENGNGIALDADGSVYICGTTNSADFPVTAGCAQAANAGGNPPPRPLGGNYPGYTDAFVFKLNAAGSAPVYGTYLGGRESRFPWLNDGTAFPSPSDVATKIAVDSGGNAVVIGFTRSSNFPTVNAVQGVFRGPFEVPGDDVTNPGVGPGQDGFITKVNPAGTAWVFSTYMGNAGNDICTGVAFDNGGNVVVSGTTASVGPPTDPNAFVTTVGAYDRTVNGQDAFVLKLPPAGAPLTAATVLGGNAAEGAAGVTSDGAGNVYLTGFSQSINFPTTVGAFDRTYNNGLDMWITKFNPSLSGLVYSTFLGSSGLASTNDIVVDDTGVTYVTGRVRANTLTTVGDPSDPFFDTTYNGPPETPLNPGGDVFLLALNDAGSQLLYCSYYGGEEYDEGLGIGIDGSRSLYIAGRTRSWQEGAKVVFPTSPGVFKRFMILDSLLPPALFDGLVMKIKIRVPVFITSLVINPNDLAGGQTATGTVTLNQPASTGGALIVLTSSIPGAAICDVDSFIIPEGETVGTFGITSFDVTDTYVTKITAKYEGDGKTVGVTVSPWLTALTISSDRVVGGNVVTGRVTLYKPAPAGGATIGLASSNPAIASVPALITVPEGLTTAVFDINTNGVTVDTPVQITGTYRGTARSATLLVQPATLTSLRFSPNRVSPTQSSTCIVALNGKAGAAINLQIDQTAKLPLPPNAPPDLTFPTNVTIPAGAREIQFTVTAPAITSNSSWTLRARRLPGLTEPVTGTLFADFTQIDSITLSSTNVLGGEIITGFVNLTNPAAPGGLTINLLSSNPAAGQVSSPTVDVLSGATVSEPFQVITNPVETDQVMTVTAQKAGLGSASRNITVRALTWTFVLAPVNCVGGVANSTGTVTISENAPAGGIPVILSSSNTNAATVPAQVLIPAGQRTVQFTVTTRAVTSDVAVTISARIGSTTKTQILNVLAPGIESLVIVPSTLTGGATATGTVTLDSNAPTGGITVTISSSNPAVAAVNPTSILIPAGQRIATFGVQTFPVPQNTNVTITASRGNTQRQAVMTVNAPQFATLSLVPNQVRGGLTSTGTITLDQPAPAGGITVNLSASVPSLVTMPSSVVIPAGQTSRSFVIQTQRVSRNIAVEIIAEFANRPERISAFLFIKR